MVSFLKRSNTPSPSTEESTDNEKLLAAKKRRGLFGRKNNNNNTDRSDAISANQRSGRSLSPFKRRKDVEQAASAAEPTPTSKRVVTMTRAKSTGRGLPSFKRRMSKDNSKNAVVLETPPVTPEKMALADDDTPLQVKVVTVKAHQATPRRDGQDNSNDNNNSLMMLHDEDETVMSDLTDNRTYKRLADYKQTVAKEREALAAAAKAEAELAAGLPKDRVANVRAHLDQVQGATNGGGATSSSSQPKSFCGEGDGSSLNPVTYFLSYMDHACTPTPSTNDINQSYSFVPEWGMAPSKDERDKTKSPPVTAVRSDDHEDNDDETTSRQAPSPAPYQQQQRTVKDEVHENFEMVLEDLQSTEDHVTQKKQHRNWMGAMSFRKNNNNNNAAEQEAKQQQEVVPPVAENEQVRHNNNAATETTAPSNVSPLTVEEEKKEDDSGDEGSAGKEHSGARKMGSKLLKSFRRLKNNPKGGDLPPVTEGEYENGETTELMVRVPDNGRALTEQDLIGEQLVQDIYRDLESTLDAIPENRPPEIVETTSSPDETEGQRKVEERPSSPHNHSTMDSTIPSKDPTYDEDDESTTGGDTANNMINSFMSLLTGTKEKELPDEVRDIPEKGDIPKSKSWVDQFRLTMSEDTHETSVTPFSDNQRQRSAPHKMMNQKHRKQKQMWREAADPKTGRPYFYHRMTREVTWKKPQEMIDFEEQQAEKEKKESHRKLVSVLSDGDLAAAAERTEEGKADAAMRKKNARDFDPNVWSTKEEVVKLLQTMAPPDGSSVEQILKKYEGREEVLLQQLREMKAAKPFDEPVADDDDDTTEQPKREDPPRSKSVPRPRSTPPVIKRSNSWKKANSFKNTKKNSKRDEKKRPDPEAALANSVEKQSPRAPTPELKTRASPVPSQETKKSDNGGKKSEGKGKKKPDSPTRNVARAVRARLAARRARDAASSTAQQQAAKISPNLNQPSQDEDSDEPGIIRNSSKRPGKENATTLDSVERDPDFTGTGLHTPEAITGRVRTHGSGVTKFSEKTEVIKNTKKRSTLGTVGELRSAGSDATSLSSTGMEPRVSVSMAHSPAVIPVKITAPRTRELMVEEFSSTTDRPFKAEVYDKKRTVRAGRFGATGTRRRKPFTSPSLHYHDGDDSTRTDSVSALSMDDNKPNYLIPSSYGAKGGVDDARKRALDNAIAREDWDLAAVLSESMRTIKTRPVMPPQHGEWKQSELDRFISQNDWDAVANYIATVRAKTKKDSGARSGMPSRSVMPGHLPVNAVEALTPPPNPKRMTRRNEPAAAHLFDEADELMGNPKKRFGAKSQLQHKDIPSESSYDSEESSYYSDDYSSSSSYSEPSRGKNRYRYASKHSLPIKSRKGGRPKEFAC